MNKRASFDVKLGGEVPPHKRLKSNIEDLMFSGDISALRGQQLAIDGQDSKPEHLEHIVRAGNRGRCPGNVFRDVLRRKLKRKNWPSLYYAHLRVMNLKTQRMERTWVPMLLPHEIVQAIASKADMQTFLSQEGLTNESKAHLEWASAQMKVASSTVLFCSLWGDGVPCNWDRSQSIECFSLSFPGLTNTAWGTLRIPLFGINKKFIIKSQTLDDALQVVSWSFNALASGQWPCKRHDNKAWLPTDSKRAKEANKCLLLRGVLGEVRGDWVFYKSTFRFPQFNETRGSCWRCSVTPATFRDVGANAAWRVQRLSHYHLMARFVELGVSISPIFSSPFLKATCFKVDWLHTMDLGVTCDFLASLFFALLPKLPGGSEEMQCSSLFRDIQTYYRDHEEVTSKLDNLTLSMLGKKSKGPKLRAKAAEARFLVPFAKQAANRYFADDVPCEKAIKDATNQLAACYDCLSGASYSSEALKDHSRRFCLLAVALESAMPGKLFHVRPKLHLMQELCEMNDANPSLYWNYRDEDFGGTLAALSKRRGGSNNPTSTSRAMLFKFMASNSLPRI